MTSPVQHPARRTDRRSDALSKTRIVEVAIAVLDEGGTDALTFRVLASRLATGPGAIYNHLANKADLLVAAALQVMSADLDTAPDAGDVPTTVQDVRVVMINAFDAISAHPWLGTQLAAAPWQPAVMQIFERVGAALDSLGVPDRAQFDAASLLVQHVLGVASQYAAAARLSHSGMDRPAFLRAATADLTDHDRAKAYPFLTRIDPKLISHDDREQFLSGAEIILAGIATL